MRSVVGEHARIDEAFKEPALTMLRWAHAQLTVTIFRVCFSHDAPAVPMARMHLLVDGILVDLRAAGVTGVPEKQGQKLCQEWVARQWLNRETSGDYTLTYQAQKALELVDLLTHDRSTLSEHRISTILDSLRRFNAAANPDRDERMRLYKAQIDELQAKFDFLDAGGEVPAPTSEYMLQGYIDVLDLVSGLPADFTRVQEAFERIRKQILEEFRSDVRPPGMLVATYLQHADDLIAKTPEGRAFDGALALLRDSVLEGELDKHLRALLAHPQAGEILGDEDRRTLRSTAAFIRRGFVGVTRQRSQTTESIRNYLQTHDADQDRELGRALKSLEARFVEWLERTGPNTSLESGLLPEQVQLRTFPVEFHDPAADVLPPPLPEAEEAVDLSVQDVVDLAVWGGPTLPLLQTLLEQSVAEERHAALSGLFNSLEPELRRPVEILGLHYLADRDGLLEPADSETLEEFHAIRPDGSTRTFVTARARLTRPDPQEPA